MDTNTVILTAMNTAIIMSTGMTIAMHTNMATITNTDMTTHTITIILIITIITTAMEIQATVNQRWIRNEYTSQRNPKGVNIAIPEKSPQVAEEEGLVD